jgi:16S rRNA (cytidine1402-2'-O)-methyltransferase
MLAIVGGGAGRRGGPARHDDGVPLVLAATPIGNLGDASPRLREALVGADVIAAEDTRRLRRLVLALGIDVTARVVSYYDSVERERTAALLDDLRAGRTVVLVTDAGTPLVSDPGHRLLAAAVEADVDVDVLPGPSAVLAALALAGLPADRWCFEGFLPRRGGERRTRLAELADDRRALVFFESPHRLAAALVDAAAVFGEHRRAAVCRELTKLHQEVRRGPLGELAAWAADGVRGEVTVVVAGAEPTPVEHDPQALADEVAAAVAAGSTRRDAVDAVASRHGISRRQVYALITRL